MNDPFILYAIARFANTSILLNLVRASRQFHALLAENVGVKYDLMDCYSIDGVIKCTNGRVIKHGKTDYVYVGLKWKTEYYRADKLHRNGDLPAVIYAASHIQEWFRNGRRHRDNDLPAIINQGGNHEWYQYGILHRDNDQPALISSNGKYKAWYKHGKLHRDGDLPAMSGSEYEQWYKDGHFHRGAQK